MADKKRTLFTTQEAAALIGYSDSRLRQLIGAGKARPKQRIGKSWVFSAKEIERLCNRRAVRVNALTIPQE